MTTASAEMLGAVQGHFEANTRKVRDLIDFDRTVLELVIGRLERIKEAQDRAGEAFKNPKHRVEGVINMVKNIRDEDSLAMYYDTIHNQALVLLVSYFAAALRDAYRIVVGQILPTGRGEQLLKEELKLTIAEILGLQADVQFQIADLLINKKDLSFQDMKSTARAFREISGFAPARTEVVNDIILAQAARHVVVHTGALVTDQMLRQIESAEPRTLKPELQVGEALLFSPDELTTVAGAMRTYLADLASGIRL